MKYFNNNLHYEKIIELICGYKGIKKEELIEILMDEECKYLLFLLLKKYNCVNEERIKEDFNIENIMKIKAYIDKAEKKLMFNKKIRDMYFEAENIIEK